MRSAGQEDSPLLAVSLLLPLVGPPGRRPPDANLLRRGILRMLKDSPRDAIEGARTATRFHADPGPAGHAWAVSPPVHHRGGWWFRLTAVGVESAVEIAEALWADARLVPSAWRLGELEHVGVAAIDAQQATSPQNPPTPNEQFAVTFLTQAAFSGRRRGAYDALPELRLLVRGWRERWHAYFAPDHPFDALLDPRGASTRRFTDWLEEVIVDTTRLKHGLGGLPGTTRGSPPIRVPTVEGHFTLTVQGSPCAERDALRALVRFAEYAGTGRHRNFGLGQTLASVPGTEDDPDSWQALFARHRFGIRDRRAARSDTT